MTTPSSDSVDLTLAGSLTAFADAIATYKNVPGTASGDWTTLDNLESDLRGQVALLTVEAVTATLAAANQSLADVQAGVKDANAAVAKITASAAAITKVAGVIAIAGTLVGLATSIYSGNAAGVVTALKALPAQVTALNS